LNGSKSAFDTNELVTHQLNQHFKSHQLQEPQLIYNFSCELHNLFKKLNKNSLEEQVHRSLKRSGFVLLFINLGTFLIASLLSKGGFSLGLAFSFFSILLWLWPSLFALYSIRSKLESSLNRQRVLTTLNWIFVVGHSWLLLFL
jgi:hypothetical protein